MNRLARRTSAGCHGWRYVSEDVPFSMAGLELLRRLRAATIFHRNQPPSTFGLVDVPGVVGVVLLVSATILLPLWLFARVVMRPERRRHAREDFPSVSKSRWTYFGSNAILYILMAMFAAGGVLLAVVSGAA